MNMVVLYIWLMASIVGTVYYVVHDIVVHRSSRQPVRPQHVEHTTEKPVETMPDYYEQLEFLKSQRRDYMELYDYAQLEYSKAETIQQKERYKKRLISLDAKLFSLDQKIAKLQKS